MNAHPALGKYVLLLAILALGICLSLPFAPAQHKRRVEWPVMGTVGAITFRGVSPERQDDVRAKVQKTWSALEKRLSAWSDTSELAHLAPALAQDGEKALDLVPEDVRPCYAMAFDLKKRSGGAFNPVLGDALRRTGFTRRTAVDLGAIAKGFAVDQVEKDVAGCDALLDLGGNLRAFGGTWRTGILNPFSNATYIARFDLKAGEAVATSGNYARFVTVNGKRLSHILDGRTLAPASGIASVTVIAPSAMLSDGLSTTLFVLGIRDGRAFLKRHYPAIAALWIADTPEKPVLSVTPAMALRLSACRAPVEVIHGP